MKFLRFWLRCDQATWNARLNDIGYLIVQYIIEIILMGIPGWFLLHSSLSLDSKAYWLIALAIIVTQGNRLICSIFRRMFNKQLLQLDVEEIIRAMHPSGR